MALNPQLSSEVSPIGYQATPSGLTTGLNLLGDVIGSMKGSGEKAPSTIDERAANAWEEFAQVNESLSTEDEKGNRVPVRLGDAPMESLLAFEKSYPQFSNWARDTYKTQRLSPDPTQAAGQEAVISAVAAKEAAWANSLDFATAASVAQAQFPNDAAKQESFIVDSRAAWDTKQRELASAAEAVKGEQDIKAVSDLTWGRMSTSLAPRVVFTNNGLLEIYRNIQRSPNSSFDLAQEAPQLLTMMPELSGFTVINRNNIESFSQALKMGLVGMTKREMQDAGITAYDPPADWSKANFAILDDTIEDINAGVSPEALVKNQQDIGAMNLMQLMQETGNDGIFVLGKMFPNAVGPDQFNELKTIVGAAGTQFTKDALASPDSQISAIEGSSIDGNVKARDFFLGALTGTMPKNTATVTNSFATAALGVFANQSEVATNGGKDQSASLSRLDAGVYNTAIAANPQAILEAANSSPAFRQKFTVSVKQDLSRDIAEVRALAAEQGITMTVGDDGTFSFTRDESAASSKTSMVPANGMPLGGKAGFLMNEQQRDQNIIDTFQNTNSEMLKQISGKLTAIDLLGEVGSSIKEGLIAPTVQAGGGGSGSEGTTTTPIGDALGIDFSALEAENGLPQGYLERTAYLESKGDPNAKNPNSSAGGLFQQIDANAKENNIENRFDPVQSTDGAVDDAVKNTRMLTRVLGRKPTGAELYLAHMQGGAGASRILRDPSAKAIDVVGKDSIVLNGGTVDMTAGEFANLWLDKYNNTKSIPPTVGKPSDANAVAAKSGEAIQRAVEDYVAPSGGLELSAGGSVAPSATPAPVDAQMPQEAPKEAPVEGSTAVGEVPVTMAGRALLAALGGTADRVFKSVEEMDAATDLAPGEVVQVGGEVFVIRKDGSKQKVGDNVLQ